MEGKTLALGLAALIAISVVYQYEKHSPHGASLQPAFTGVAAETTDAPTAADIQALGAKIDRLAKIEEDASHRGSTTKCEHDDGYGFRCTTTPDDETPTYYSHEPDAPAP